MTEEDLDSLKQKHLDLFDEDEAKFDLFCKSLNYDPHVIRVALKELKKKKNNQSFAYNYFEQWSMFLEQLKQCFDAGWSDRYYYQRKDKDCFRFKYFVADLLEAKAMQDSPKNPQGRYSMLKTELIKYLQNEKPKNISARSKEQQPLLSEVEEKVVEEVVENAGQTRPKPGGIAGIIKGGSSQNL
jgi:hypothetical protein